MIARSLTTVAELVAGRLVGDDASVAGASTDSRAIRPGTLFVAVRGDRVDGHDYVDDAFRRGAAGALVAREEARTGPTVIVSDTRAALLELAREERDALAGTVVGITGSTGKTSVKDMAGAVLGTRFQVHASPRSFNTEVGVPLTLLNAPEGTEVIVCEMGSRGRGHIAALCAVARPQIGVVTNVGLAHMEMFGSPEAVAEAKAELVEALPRGGTAVLNADDPVVRAFDARTDARVLRFGTSPDADIRGEDLALDPGGRPSFTLRTPAGSERVELAVPGEHMAWNALAAATIGIALGLSAGECAAGLKEARVSDWRMQVTDGASGIRVINDAYNANPSSMAAALKAARWIAREGRCIAVLGEMAELGAIADVEHERVGELVARLGIEHLVVVGDGARLIAVGAAREGVESERVTRCATVEEAVEAVRALARAGDVVLVKGSRVAGLERVVEAIR
jgi:UDP-N-acetylmuramoyl-tripeptide--D-alanyl-D-alanine ligase